MWLEMDFRSTEVNQYLPLIVSKIVAIDSRFISERISQLKDWGIEFFQGHILDKDFLKKHLYDADVVHHLAGVTDVAYVKSQENSELDNRIVRTGVEGTNNVLNAIFTTFHLMKLFSFLKVASY